MKKKAHFYTAAMRKVPRQAKNRSRAYWAEAALDAFIAKSGDNGDLETNVIDLVADMMHLCREKKLKARVS